MNPDRNFAIDFNGAFRKMREAQKAKEFRKELKYMIDKPETKIETFQQNDDFATNSVTIKISGYRLTSLEIAQIKNDAFVTENDRRPFSSFPLPEKILIILISLILLMIAAVIITALIYGVSYFARMV